MPTSKRTLVRVQEKGQVTLPAAIRRKLGLKKGDLVAIQEVDNAVTITPQRVVPAGVLDRLGRTLAEQGISAGELLAWAQAGVTAEGVPLRAYSEEELNQFLVGDTLTEEEQAIVHRSGWGASKP